MDGWNDDSGFSMENEPSSESRGTQAITGGIRGGGGWHHIMTLVCFVTVAALSFLMAWLTKDIVNRPFWMIGAIFTVPTLGMFAAAMMVEQKTSAMTPNTSRKSQYLVALIAVLGTFAVGCLCDIIYQRTTMDQIIKNWAEAHPPEKVYSDIVLMVDKSTSLEDNGMDTANRKAIKEWVNDMDDKARVGIVVFSGHVHKEVPINALSENRKLIGNAVDVNTEGYTNFDISLYHAFRLIDDAESGRAPGRTTQIIAITDAEADLYPKVMEAYAQLARDKNVAFSIVHLAHDVPADNPLMKLAAATGGTGTSVGVSELSRYFEGIQNAEEPDWNTYYAELRRSGEVDFDLIRVSDPAANLLCGIMLGLEGLTIGLCLMLMLSVRGQKRIQPLISVVMAAIAFVLLKVVGPGIGPVEGNPRLEMQQWLLEGISFSLLGIVFMNRNNRSPVPTPRAWKTPSVAESSNDFGGGSNDDLW